MANYLSVEKRKQVFHLLCEGNGMRSISRIAGCSTKTISMLQGRLFSFINFINKKHIKNLDVDEIEADELRTFVNNRTNLRWIYVALDRKSRMVLHFHVGKRDTNDARIFLSGLSDKLNKVSKVSTDCLHSYISAIEKNPENYTPVSRTDSIELLRSKHLGKKLGRSITNRIETHNGNIRQHISRLIRRTRCFSKRTDKLREHLTLFFFYYNFIKIHESLKTSPCVAGGIIEKPFTFDELMEYDMLLTGGQPTKEVLKEGIYMQPKLWQETSVTKPSAVLAKFKKVTFKKGNGRMYESKSEAESAAATLGRLGGLKGGNARAMSLTPERRKEIAQKAAKARWGKTPNISDGIVVSL